MATVNLDGRTDAPTVINAATNEVQTVTITGGPTAGTFTLTYGGQTTAAIAYNATAAAVGTALEALSTIGAGNVATAGGPLPGAAVAVTFQGALGARNVATMTATSSLTGGTTPTVTVAETTPGYASSATPTATSDVYLVADSTATMYLSYVGTASGTIRVWLSDGTDWYKGASHTFNSADGKTAVAIAVPSRGFTLQVETFTGTASSVTAKVSGK